jgi:hypothetical protein
MASNRRSLIVVRDVDRIFDDVVIKELAKVVRSPANANLSRFAQSIRNDARLFIEAKGCLNYPQLRREIERLYTLNNRAMRGDREAQQLARAVDALPADVRDWLARCNPRDHDRTIPKAAEIVSQATRAGAVQRLRLILSYGVDVEKKGRKRPTGKRSRSIEPLLRVPAKIEPNRPRSDAEREFVRNLGLTYLDATGKRPPRKVDFETRGPFSQFVHKCFELVGAPQGYVTKLINELGQARARSKTSEDKFDHPQDFGAYLDDRERFHREQWRAEAQQPEPQIDGSSIKDGGKPRRK